MIYFSNDQKLQHEQNYLRTIDFMYMYDCETQSLTSNVRIPIITFLITALHQSG